jgi:DNA-binding response OmpR family regulator
MSPSLNIEIVSLNQVPVVDSSIPSAAKLRPVIVVVDDERVIADTLSIILTKNGFSVLTAYSAESALELVRVVPPDLLLSDVMMGPGMDGTQLAVEVVTAYPACKVLLFSGHAATRDLLDKVGELGHHFTLLTKPLHPSDLLARISESFVVGRVASA